MKFSTSIFRSFSLACLVAGAGVAQAQTTVTTNPVGFITRTIAGATSPTSPSVSNLAVPLYAASDYVSSVLTVDGTNQVTLAGAAWVAGQFAVPTAPRLLRVKSSTSVANVGRTLLVTGNTATQLTVALADGISDIHSVIAAGDICEVIPANTLSILFGATATGFQTGSSAAASDNVLVFNGTSWDTYYNNATNWKKAGSLSNFNNTIVYPDDGVMVVRIASNPLTITFVGSVPSSAELNVLGGAGSTFIANRFPVDTTLAGLGLSTSPNWTNGNSASAADNVLVWNGTTWDTYYYTGVIWKKSGSVGSVDRGTTVISSATSVFIRRINSSISQVNLPLPYAL